MPDKPEKANNIADDIRNGDLEDGNKKENSPGDRSYYYDDAHGYEDFDPDSDDEAGED